MENNTATIEILNNQKSDISKILGYGEKLKVFNGKNKDGDDTVIVYHFCPVTLSDLPNMIEALNTFGSVSESKSFSDSLALESAAKIIQLSLKKAHGEISIQDILNQFSLSDLAKAIKISLSLNDFLSEMQTIKETFKSIES